MQGECSGSTEMGIAEDVGSAFERELSAEAQAAHHSPEGGQLKDDLSAAADDLLAPEVPPSYNGMTANGKSCSLSPESFPQPCDGLSHQQLNADLPGLAAPAAEAPAPAAQEEEPWQKAETAQRKPVSQQAPQKAGRFKPKKQGKDGPADPPSPLRELQAAAQDPQQSSQKMAERTPQVQPVNVAAEQLPATKGSAPQQPAEHDGLDSLQSSVSGAVYSRMQHERMQKHAKSMPTDQPHMAPQQTLLSGLRSASFSDEQVGITDWPSIDIDA